MLNFTGDIFLKICTKSFLKENWNIFLFLTCRNVCLRFCFYVLFDFSPFFPLNELKILQNVGECLLKH